MKLPKHNIAFICVLFQTPSSEVERLKKEISHLNAEPYFIDNTVSRQGYAYGVNKGLRMALHNKNINYFIVANPDISIRELHMNDLQNVLKHFDIAGFAMKQHGTIYYGGELDKWRLSGGLIKKKPEKQFMERDFVSGSLMVIKREVIESIGLFDESYGMYYEEVDYCIRARQAGFQIGIDTQHLYEHFEQSVTNKNKDYYLAKNRWKLLWRYGNWKQKMYEIIRLPKTFYEYLS